MSTLTDIPEWLALERHAADTGARHLRDLFAQEDGRFEKYSLEAAGLFLDYSKQRIDDAGLNLLLDLADARGLNEAIAVMFAGEPINPIEGKAALHVALRAPRTQSFAVNGRQITAQHDVLFRIKQFCDAVHTGFWKGHTGEPIRDIVNIGIGGSDLGARMVCRGLRPSADKGLAVHFVANADPAALAGVLNRVRPQSTLFIVSSKSFATAETLANAAAAKAWLIDALEDSAAVEKHFLAVSANEEAVREFGIEANNFFPIWDWVGGRYSLWSAVGLPIALYLGFDRFRALLDGAHAMDEHFRGAPLAQNMPVLLALAGIWNRNFLGLGGQVIAPYAQGLELLVDHLQQLEMESNGKRVTHIGQPVDYATGAPLWGGVGSSAQHAFFQLLHQGTETLPVDFILPLASAGGNDERQTYLLASCLAQAAALMQGRQPEEVRAQLARQGLDNAAIQSQLPHRCYPGNRPSNMILLPALSPAALGALIALYEHKVYVQSVIWGINAFDQWGVELGKQMARDLVQALHDGDGDELDESTRGLLSRIRKGLN